MVTNKYYNLLEALSTTGTGTMKCYGNSMLPILSNPSTCSYQKQDSYQVGDIVFCKVRGRFIDAHKVLKIDGLKDSRRYLIGNNHGRINGWTRQIYGKVIKSINKHGQVEYQAKS